MSRHINRIITNKGWTKISEVVVALVMTFFCVGTSYATQDLGYVAKTVTDTFEDLTRLITAASYIAGLGFAIGSIMKFKQHRDNPTQIPIGTPIALLFIAAALLFLPTLLEVTGKTLFGSSGGQTGGPKGVIFGEH